LSDRLAYRLAYAAMVLSLAAACTPGETDIAAAPAAPAQPDIAAPAAESGPAAPNTPDTLASAPAADPEAAVPASAAPPAPAATPPANALAPPPAASATAPDLALGAAAWARTCAVCHGADGKGTQMAAAIVTRSVDAVKTKVVKGTINPGDKMPPMGAALSAEELEAVAHFVAAGFTAQ